MSTLHPQAHGLLAGKVVVITGAGGGFGRACTRLFVREGASVLAADISGAEEVVAAEVGPAVVPFRADISQEQDVEAMFARAVQAFGRVDALLNSAATLASRNGEVTLDEYERMTNVNLRGALLCSKHAVRTMLATGGGSIVNVSTVGALNTETRASVVYSAAKAGLNAMTKSFAIQFGAQGIRANILASGFTLTEQNRAQALPEVMRQMSAKAAMGRAGRAEEQAEVAAFLVSDRASFVSGAIFPVDGGWSARLA